jgi:hypothetical protein
MTTIEEYLEKRRMAVTAETKANDIVERLIQASRMLGATGGRAGYQATWRDANIPGMPGISGERASFRSSRSSGIIDSIPDWPTQTEVFAAMNEYWAAINVADKAYAAISSQDRSSIQPPPGYPQRR